LLLFFFEQHFKKNQIYLTKKPKIIFLLAKNPKIIFFFQKRSKNANANTAAENNNKNLCFFAGFFKTNLKK